MTMPEGGGAIGVIVLDTGFERLPGDVASAATWPFPVRFAVARGVRPADVIEGDAEAALDVFRRAIDELVDRGVEAITTSCGFLSAVQPRLRAHSPVPFVASALQQIPLVLGLLPPDRTVGLLVSDRGSLRDRHFDAIGVPTGLPMAELPVDGVLRTHMRENRPKADRAAQEREVIEVGATLLAAHPEVGAIVCECANLPPHSAALRRAVGVPVFDIVTLIDWLHAGLAPRRHAGGEAGRGR